MVGKFVGLISDDSCCKLKKKWILLSGISPTINIFGLFDSAILFSECLFVIKTQRAHSNTAYRQI